MQEENKVLTQSEVLKNELERLAKDVTKADREAFLDKHSISKSTLSMYLNGDVRDNDTAVTIISFMQGRIEERYKKIR